MTGHRGTVSRILGWEHCVGADIVFLLAQKGVIATMFSVVSRRADAHHPPSLGEGTDTAAGSHM